MQAVLSLIFLVATTLACPTCHSNAGGKSIPTICPATWKVRTFDSQCVSSTTIYYTIVITRAK